MPEKPGQRIRVQIDGQELELSNLDKVLYPAAGFTKGEVIDYYTRVAPMLLPHLRDRPLTRIRYPNGVEAASFFEKNTPGGTPTGCAQRLPVPGSSTGRETIDFIVVDGLATLVWLANLAALELHTPQWRLDRQGPGQPGPDGGRPRPGPPAGLDECCEVAVLMRDRLEVDGLTPVSRRRPARRACSCAPGCDGSRTSEEVSGYAKRVAEELEEALPDLVTAKMAKNLRPGKVFIDWSQNAAAKTTVSPYSLRAAADADRLGAAHLGRGRGGAGAAAAPGRGAGADREERRPARRPAAHVAHR